jgi:hypothetical protein
MPYPWEDREKVKAGIRSAGLWGEISWCLGIIFAIIGIVAGAIDAPIGLGVMNWFLLAIVTLLLSATCFISWAVAWYLQEKK